MDSYCIFQQKCLPSENIKKMAALEFLAKSLDLKLLLLLAIEKERILMLQLHFIYLLKY